jgi:hypothetical protein
MKARRSDILDIALLTGSVLALGISVLAAGSMSIIAGVNNLLQLVENARAAWSVTLIFSAMGLLTIPGLYLSLRSIEGRPALVSDSISPIFFILGIGFPLALALGELSWQFNILPSFLEPLAHVIAAITPMIFMSIYVIRKLPLIPWRRIWGQFTAGLWLSPLIALIVELLTAIPLLLLLFAYVFTEINPRDFLGPLTSGSPLDQGYLEAQLESIVNQPLLIIAVMLFVSVLIPLLEEIIKTIGLWPMIKRGINAPYAFAGGVVAGGAYGLFEAFFLVQTGEGWALLMIARAGATIMHMITTGMSSLGFALAASEKKWTTALRYYIYAVLLHGSWNLAAVGVGFAYLSQGTSTVVNISNGVAVIVIASGVTLAILTAGAIFGLHAFPKFLLIRYGEAASQEASAVES